MTALNNKSTRQGQALSGAFVMQSAVHGAAVGGGAPALGTDLDHLTGDADGDLLRRHRQDRGADGGVHQVDRGLVDARLQQPLIHRCGFPPGADDPHIGEGAPKGLLLHLEVPDMAAGHDDHKVLVGDGQIVADAGEVPADHLLRRGEQPGVGQLRPVVEHHRAEADGGQQGAQGLGDMSRAEQQGPLAHRQGQGDIPRRHGEARGPQGLGGILRQAAGNHALPVQQRRGGAVLRQHQPAGGAAVQQGQGPAGGLAPQGVLRRDKLKMGGNVAAADHADIPLRGLVQGELPDAGAALGQQLLAQLDAAALHRAAADGAHQAALRPHQHLCPGLPGGAAPVGDEGHQHRVPVLFHLVKQLGENLLHGVSSPSRPGSPPAATDARHPRPGRTWRRWGKSSDWGCGGGRTPPPCPYRSQNRAARRSC